jgi:hypothetical protein
MNVHADNLIGKLRCRGVEVALRHGQVSIRPLNSVPPELVTALERNRAVLFARLLRERGLGNTLMIHGVTEEQAGLIVKRVQSEGYVPVWSEILGDLIYFCRDEQAAREAPRGVAAYTMEEAELLFGDPGWQPTENGMQMIHRAKLLGGRVTDVQ